MKSKNFDFIVVGAGIFGLSTAFSLNKRGYSVCLLSEGDIPNHLASSTDISKIARLEYGNDSEYMDMAERSLEQWRNWNELFDRKVFHETGFLLLCKNAINTESQRFERNSLSLLSKRGIETEILSSSLISKSYPAFNSDVFVDGFYNSKGGFVESAETIRSLHKLLQIRGVVIRDQSRVGEINSEGDQVQSLVLENRSEISGDRYIFCTGCHTPRLLGMEEQFDITGHPIFHLKVDEAQVKKFSSPQMPVFSADISNTGWYGFPIHPEVGVVKVAQHGSGIPVDPLRDTRLVTKDQEKALRTFLRECIPDLHKAPIVVRRLCCYTDTPDGHFWIDHHHDWKNATVATGGSGHGFKMGPELGEMIALTALGENHAYSDRYRARSFDKGAGSEEQARAGRGK